MSLCLSGRSVKFCDPLQDQNDATAALVDDSIWSIFSQAVPDGKAEVQRDTLTFTCLRGCSLDDFCSMFDEVFVLFQVIKSRGALHRLFYGICLVSYSRRCLGISSNLGGKGIQGTLAASLVIVPPLLNAFHRTLGIENYGSGFLDVRGFVEALYLKNCSAKASFISKPMMAYGLYLGCNLHFLFIYKCLQNPRGWRNEDPEPRVGGRGVRPKAEKKIVTPPVLMPKGTSGGSPGVQDVFEVL